MRHAILLVSHGLSRSERSRGHVLSHTLIVGRNDRIQDSPQQGRKRRTSCIYRYIVEPSRTHFSPQSKPSWRGTSTPSSLLILLVFRTFPLTLSLLLASNSSVSTLPLNQPPHLDFAVGMKSSVSGMRRIWYRLVAYISVNSHCSSKARLRRFDLNQLSMTSPMMGTIPAMTSKTTLSS